MRPITNLFNGIVTAFNAGDTLAAAGPMVTPMPIYIGSKMIVVDQIGKVVDVLNTYRANLKARAHHTTQYRIVDQQITRSGALKVLIEWTNKTADERIINQAHGAYYCRRHAQGWEIELVEFAEPQSPELLDGVTLH